ncbi:FAD-dependent oxidoreductase [Microbacterium sp. Marseille-Q6965]|uniref:FAD-dependent oxidoreductase n=1 Tax=Microbacterium sp. Marseille-Q6965 TaxID=2965072 RepID=UPI0021B7D846|nr:FAD-dependent oxidoreductase [Microbacterium sp. Marseille-Q6965]
MATHTHDVIIIGGGNGGIAAAAQLRRRGARDIVVVDPAAEHVYKPLQNYVGTGLAPASTLSRPQADVIPEGVAWARAAATRIDGGQRTVELEDGTVLRGGDILLACGAVTDWEALPGARAALGEGIACTTYERDHLEATWERIRTLTSGLAVFTLHDQPASGRETALKPLFLACDHWRREGVLDAIEVRLVHAGEALHPVAPIEEAIRRHLDAYGVITQLGTRVQRIDGRAVTLEGPDGTSAIQPDLLHLLPPYAAPALIRASRLDGPGTHGFARVDPLTLQHPDHARLWCIGDAAHLGDARTGGALRHQVQTVVENMHRHRKGRPLAEYDGYTVAPIATARRSLFFGEYDSRTHEVRRSVPLFDNLRSRPWWYLLDRQVLPQLYWHGILKGRI